MELAVLVGPTGVGKTAFAIEMAKELDCPIINADSRQIYRELPIGTAAPTAEEQAQVKHYFVGCKSIREDYNAGQYERDCLKLIERLSQEQQQRGKETIALLTGGSMMYIDAVCQGLDDIPSVSAELRQDVQRLYAEKGLEGLQQEVQLLDPAYWAIVDQANPQRLMHAIEVCRATGKTYSEHRTGQVQQRPFTICKMGLKREREQLYKRINLRVTKMVEAGLLKEAEQAFEALELDGSQPFPNSLNTVGYKEIYTYLQGLWSWDRAVEMIQQNSRHYAKRQMTWWNRDKQINWIDLK